MTIRLAIIAAIAVATLLGPAYSAAQQDLSEDNRDWAGMRRDLYHLIGWQVVSVAIMYHAPFEVSNWNEQEKASLGFEQWGDNATDPVWDEDHWAVNYVTHPYWGAGYYIRGRERGFSRRESFWISALYSTVYEFGIESFMEQPSIQDLIVTPVAGTALGFYFEKVRDRIRSRPGPLSLSDRLKLGFTDPLGALNRGVDRLLGIDEEANSNLTIGFRPIRAASQFRMNHDGRYVSIAGGGTDGYQVTFVYRW